MKTMKTTIPSCFCVAVALLTLQTNVHAVAYRVNGILTDSQFDIRPDWGPAIGQSFSALWSFDETMPDTMVGDGSSATTGRFWTPASFLLTVADLLVMDYTGLTTTWTMNKVSDQFICDATQQSVTTPYGRNDTGLFQLSLLDSTGHALTSDSIPADFHISDWSSARLRVIGHDGISLSFLLDGNITDISRVPDSGTTTLLLALGMAGVLGIRRVISL